MLKVKIQVCMMMKNKKKMMKNLEEKKMDAQFFVRLI